MRFILNALGAAWDLLTFFDTISENGSKETLYLVGPAKKASHTTAKPLVINQELIKEVYTKAAESEYEKLGIFVFNRCRVGGRFGHIPNG